MKKYLLPFSYDCEKSIEVYSQSIKYLEENGYWQRIDELAWVINDIQDLIPETLESFWSGHIFPWGESFYDIQVSFNLCLFGFYKQAMVSLRSALELGLLSVYWNLNDDGHTIIQEWLQAQEETPYRRDIWKKFEQHQNFRFFQKKYDIKSRIENLGFLHNYVHTRGRKYSNSLGLMKSSFPTFEITGFELWFKTYEEIVKVIAILHLVKYPLGTVKFEYYKKFGIDTPSFGSLDPDEVERLERIVGQDIFEIINDVARMDDNARSVLDWVSSLPDMTDEEREHQIIEFDKLLIQHGNFQDWLQKEFSILEMVRSTEEKEKYARRIELLTNWAREHGYADSIEQKD